MNWDFSTDCLPIGAGNAEFQDEPVKGAEGVKSTHQECQVFSTLATIATRTEKCAIVDSVRVPAAGRFDPTRISKNASLPIFFLSLLVLI